MAVRNVDSYNFYLRVATVLMLFLIWRELRSLGDVQSPLTASTAMSINGGGGSAGGGGGDSDNAIKVPALSVSKREAGRPNNYNNGNNNNNILQDKTKPKPPPKSKSPPSPPSGKRPYNEPVRDPSWVLLPDAEVLPLAPLPGEGVVEPAIAGIQRKGRGVIFNAVHRDTSAKRASKNIVEAMRSAKRMHVALEGHAFREEVEYVLFTDREPYEFMRNAELCRDLWPECKEFAEDNSYLTKVIFYDDLPRPSVIERRERFQTWPDLWLKRIMATLNSPFAETLVVDSDVYACSNFVALFDEWLGPDNDVAITLAPAPFGCSRNYNGAFRPRFPESYANFTERNLGMQVLKTGNPEVVRLIALFRDIYVRHVNDIERISIGNDQSSFREALYTMKDTVRQRIIPSNVACRHDLGCADGCMVVHRHMHPEMSGKEYQAWKVAQNRLKKEAAAARKAAQAAKERL